MKTFNIFLLLVILWGCNSPQQTATVQDTTKLDTLEPDGTLTDTSKQRVEQNTDPAKTAVPAKEIKVFKGLYTSGNEVSTFRDCNNKNVVYWLEDESKKLASAYKKTEGFLAYPYESIYVEIKGYLKGKSTVGYASEYDNVLAVTDVVTARQKSFNTGCFAYEYIALGNEPFWSVDIIPSEKIIALKDVAAEKTYVFPYKTGKASGNTVTYETSNDKKQVIKVVLTKQTCSDGMSDRKYNYSAVVQINGKTLKGCGIKKGDKMVMNQ